MKKLFLIITLVALGSVSAQGNGDYVSMSFIKTTPGEDYWTILNEKWKDLHQMRANEGTITGWDVWYRPNTGSESDWDLLIVTVAKSPDSLNANVGIAKMRPDYSEMDIEILAEKNSGARTIVYDHFLVNKGLVFAGNEGETPVVPQVAVLNFMKVGYSDGYKYETAENSLTSVESLGNRAGWGLLKRLDALGSDIYYDYMTVDFYENWNTFMSDREPSSSTPLNRQLRDIYSMRDHKQSVPVWLAISVRPEE